MAVDETVEFRILDVGNNQDVKGEKSNPNDPLHALVQRLIEKFRDIELLQTSVDATSKDQPISPDDSITGVWITHQSTDRGNSGFVIALAGIPAVRDDSFQTTLARDGRLVFARVKDGKETQVVALMLAENVSGDERAQADDQQDHLLGIFTVSFQEGMAFHVSSGEGSPYTRAITVSSCGLSNLQRVQIFFYLTHDGLQMTDCRIECHSPDVNRLSYAVWSTS